jgi:hypothetical protein
MTPPQIIITIIVAAGLLGGLTNFFLFYNFDNNKKECWISFLKTIFLSICASVTVPLFLQIISNNLLDISNGSPFPYKNYFLAGFCVLAAFYSKRFLDDLYAKVNKAEMKAEEAKQIAENAEQKNQEIDDVESIINEINLDRTLINEYSENDIKKIVRAILESKYTYRTIAGIEKATEIQEETIKVILELLKNAGFAESKKNKRGNDIWKIIYKE